MYADGPCALPAGPCADQGFRLAVYEAGHALTARALGLKIMSVRMLPRPPVLVSDKTFAGSDWSSFIEMLEIRIIELFGGQIAEELACKTNTCCSGDVARIDELTRLVAGIGAGEDAETIWFNLEDIAQKIFADPSYRAAILPVAEFLHQRVQSGDYEVQGRELERLLDDLLPVRPKEKWLKRMFLRGRS
jgi:hypothetical protein